MMVLSAWSSICFPTRHVSSRKTRTETTRTMDVLKMPKEKDKRLDRDCRAGVYGMKITVPGKMNTLSSSAWSGH